MMSKMYKKWEKLPLSKPIVKALSQSVEGKDDHSLMSVEEVLTLVYRTLSSNVPFASVLVPKVMTKVISCVLHSF